MSVYLNDTRLKNFLPIDLLQKFSVTVNDGWRDCIVIRLVDSRALFKRNCTASIESSATEMKPRLSGKRRRKNICGSTVMGGASFQTIVTSEQRQYSCPFIDYVNGTYDVICKLYDSKCCNISVTLSYMDFGAFRWNGNYIGSKVWSRSICQPKTRYWNDYNSFVGWYRDNRTMPWRWVRSSQELMTDEQSRECIALLPFTVLFGDSHLRYALYYWLHLTGKLKPSLAAKKVNENIVVDKFSMTFITYSLNESQIPNYM